MSVTTKKKSSGPPMPSARGRYKYQMSWLIHSRPENHAPSLSIKGSKHNTSGQLIHDRPTHPRPDWKRSMNVGSDMWSSVVTNDIAVVQWCVAGRTLDGPVMYYEEEFLDKEERAFFSRGREQPDGTQGEFVFNGRYVSHLLYDRADEARATAELEYRERYLAEKKAWQHQMYGDGRRDAEYAAIKQRCTEMGCTRVWGPNDCTLDPKVDCVARVVYYKERARDPLGYFLDPFKRAEARFREPWYTSRTEVIPDADRRRARVMYCDKLYGYVHADSTFEQLGRPIIPNRFGKITAEGYEVLAPSSLCATCG
jgi:hypothetical protein